jgi:hypothetical protein
MSQWADLGWIDRSESQRYNNNRGDGSQWDCGWDQITPWNTEASSWSWSQSGETWSVRVEQEQQQHDSADSAQLVRASPPVLTPVVASKVSVQKGTGSEGWAEPTADQPLTVASLQAKGRQTHQKVSMNNTALKWIRDTNELPRGVPQIEYFDLTPHREIQIGKLIRSKGMNYEFDNDDKQPWSWLTMLQNFNADLQNRIVGKGLVSLRCQPITGSYDHKRHHAAKVLNQPFPSGIVAPIWDFVAMRTDNTEVRFHPSQTSGKVEIHAVTQMQVETTRVIPAAGLGNSDGPGTYRRIVSQAYELRIGSQEHTPNSTMPAHATSGTSSASSSWQ